MPTNNAINVSSAGIVGFNATAFVETSATNHAVLIGGATSSTFTNVGPTATAGQVLQSAGSSADPAFSTATYPATTTINQVLYSSAANVVGGITAANNGTLISGTTGVPSWLANGTTGQVLTATTGSPPSWSPAAVGSSYALQCGGGPVFTTPADSTTYYCTPFSSGSSVSMITIILPYVKIFIPKTATIVAVVGNFSVGGTLGSNENITVAVRLNDTTNTNVTTTLQATGAINAFSNTGLSIAVTAGDFISFMLITPAWGTNPTSVTFNATAFLS